MSHPHGLPPYTPLPLILERLPLVFPEGTPNRPYCTREMAAKTIFTAPAGRVLSQAPHQRGSQPGAVQPMRQS
jgi:hypothetical protein